jgi:hypothetical protein
VKELFNLTHSSLRVTTEKEFATLKNKFNILEHKPFHPFTTPSELVLACCILHNWILGSGEDKLFPETVVSDQVETYHGVEQSDNEAWKSKRMEWTTAMWDAIGSTTIYKEEE